MRPEQVGAKITGNIFWFIATVALIALLARAVWDQKLEARKSKAAVEATATPRKGARRGPSIADGRTDCYQLDNGQIHCP